MGTNQIRGKTAPFQYTFRKVIRELTSQYKKNRTKLKIRFDFFIMKGETKQSGTFINLKNQTKNVFLKFQIYICAANIREQCYQFNALRSRMPFSKPEIKFLASHFLSLGVITRIKTSLSTFSLMFFMLPSTKAATTSPG